MEMATTMTMTMLMTSHKIDHLHLPWHLLLRSQHVGGGVESLIRRRTLPGGKQPTDHRALLRKLVDEEAAQLRVVDVALLHVCHGDNVANLDINF